MIAYEIYKIMTGNRPGTDQNWAMMPPEEKEVWQRLAETDEVDPCKLYQIYGLHDFPFVKEDWEKIAKIHAYGLYTVFLNEYPEEEIKRLWATSTHKEGWIRVSNHVGTASGYKLYKIYTDLPDALDKWNKLSPEDKYRWERVARYKNEREFKVLNKITGEQFEKLYSLIEEDTHEVLKILGLKVDIPKCPFCGKELIITRKDGQSTWKIGHQGACVASITIYANNFNEFLGILRGIRYDPR